MQLSREDVADTIEAFVNDTSGEWDWDDFISIPLKDPELEAIRKRCGMMRDEFPPTEPRQYCNKAGFEAMRRIVAELRTDSTPTV